MAIVNAHIRNVDYDFVEIIIRDEFSGAVVGTKIINEGSLGMSLAAANNWIEDHYFMDNISVTTEGFEQLLTTNLVNEEGLVCLNDKKPEMSWPSLDEYVSENSIPLESGDQVENAITSYLEELNAINISVPVSSEDESLLFASQPMRSQPMNESDKIQSLPEDDQTDTGHNSHYHESSNQYQSETFGSSEISGYDVSDAFSVQHTKYFENLDRDQGQSSPKPITVDHPSIPKFKKSAVDISGFSQKKKEKLARSTSDSRPNLLNSGIAGAPLDEPVPSFDSAKYDHVISNKNNAQITLTRDRSSNLLSGYGGKGNTGAGAIDIVVGRMGNDPKKVNDDNKDIKVNPFFVPTKTNLGLVVDSARIYISQKADIDEYFKICEGRVGQSVERSAIGIKADAVRVIGNEGIKLVTKTDSINSKGGRIKKNRGVDIIANNDDAKLQPMVLGDNMQKCVGEMAEMINNMIGALQATINNVAQLDVALASHVHVSPFFGAPTLPSPNGAPMCIASLIELVSVESFSTASQKWNVNTFKWKYLKQGSPLTIRSKYNNVN